MDLMNLKPTSDIIEVTLMHPNTGDVVKNDDKTPMTITVYASHSKEHKAAVHMQTNKRLKAMQGSKKSQTFTSEEIEESSMELLARVTSCWNITYGGAMPELNVKKAREIYTEVFWIKSQVEEALAESLDFTKA